MTSSPRWRVHSARHDEQDAEAGVNNTRKEELDDGHEAQ
jgi:hypothetical protein